MPAEAPTAAGARTRQALLDAGVAVAEAQGLAGLSVNRVVAEAGVAKGTFYVHFEDRNAFVDALHARFHDRVEEKVGEATAGMPLGAEPPSSRASRLTSTPASRIARSRPWP